MRIIGVIGFLLIAGAIGLLIVRLSSNQKLNHQFQFAQTQSENLSSGIEVDLQTMNRLLTLYYGFFAIHHDHWLNSEASRTKIRIELRDLQERISSNNLIKFTGITELKSKFEKDGKNLIVKIIIEKMLMPNYKVIENGNGLRIDLPERYTEESPPIKISDLLKGSPAGSLSLMSIFLNGDYDDPGDLHKFHFYFVGNFKSDIFIIKKAGGFLGSANKISALLKASKEYETFAVDKEMKSFPEMLKSSEQAKQKWGEEWEKQSEVEHDYLASSSEEASEIMKVANKVWQIGVMEGQIKQEGSHILYKGTMGWDDFGVIALYVKYGKEIFN